MAAIKITLEMTVEFDAEAWDHTYDGWPLTQATALEHVMQMFEGDRKGTGVTQVVGLEATCSACGEPVDEAEDAEPHTC